MIPNGVLFFGAGASHGVGGVNSIPPLGTQLFSELTKRFPESWGKILPIDARLFAQNFEYGMDSIYGKLPNTSDLLKEMAIYFSKFDIIDANGNLYYKLIQILQSEIGLKKIILSTLNYDCLIELALLISGFGVKYWDMTDEAVKILKIQHIDGGGRINPGTAQIKVGLNHIHPNQVETVLSNVPLYPAMSLYAKNKPIFVGREQIEEIQQQFQNAVLSSQSIIVVGVNPNPEDQHIWNYLKDTSANLYLIGDKEACGNWISTHRNNKSTEWISNRFDTGFDRVCEILQTTSKIEPQSSLSYDLPSFYYPNKR
jgi:hypothetical protein